MDEGELWCGLQMWVRPLVAVAVVQAAAVALIPPLAREPPYASGAALKIKKTGSSRRGSVVDESD